VERREMKVRREGEEVRSVVYVERRGLAVPVDSVYFGCGKMRRS
jgi:hypothetical protein